MKLLSVCFQTSNRDTRLLAGTAVAMQINTASKTQDGAEAAVSLLQLTNRGEDDLSCALYNVKDTEYLGSTIYCSVKSSCLILQLQPC